MLFNLFILLHILFFGILLLWGLYIIIRNYLKKDQPESMTLKGYTAAGISAGIFLIVFLYHVSFEAFAFKPTAEEMVGKYQIARVTGLPIKKSEYQNYNLELKSDRRFFLDKTPYIEVCESGLYEVDYQFENNEISWQCGNGFSMTHISRGFFGYQIEFIVDPDIRQSIFFRKSE